MERDEAGSKRKKFAAISESKNMSSSEEEQKKLCCTNVAMSVYTKAWEGAKRAIPTKHGLNDDDPTHEPTSVTSVGRFPDNMLSIDSDGGGSGRSGEVSFDDPDEFNDFNFDVKMFGSKRRKSKDDEESSKRRQKMLQAKNSSTLSSQSSSELEFGDDDDLGSPEEIDLDKFKLKIANEDKRAKDAAKTAVDLINEDQVAKFARKTSKDILSDVKEEVVKVKEYVPVEVVKGDGIFKKKKETKEVIKKEISTESSFDSYSVDLPTITISEDTLGDTISQSTLRGSIGDLPDDEEYNKATVSKTDAIKTKVKEIGSKVKDIFSSSSANDDEEEIKLKKQKKEEEMKRKREEELRKKEIEMIRKELENRKKEEETKKKEEEKQKKREEVERQKKEAELKKKEEEQKRKDELLKKKETELEKKRIENEKRLEREKEKLKEEEERMKQKMLLKKIEQEINEEGIKIETALRETQEIELKMKEQKELMMSKKKKVIKVTKVSTSTIRSEDEEGALDVENRSHMTSLHGFNNELDGSIDPITSEMLNSKSVLSSSDTVNASFASDDTLKERSSASPDKKKIEEQKRKALEQLSKDIPKLTLEPSFDTESIEEHARASAEPRTLGPRGLVRSNTNATATDDELFIAIETDNYSERGVDVNDDTKVRRKKKMTKKIRDTKNRLKNMTNKALEASVASMQTIKSKVSDMMSTLGGQPGTTSDVSPYGSVKNRREQMCFSEYRDRLPDDEFFSDSEVVESRKDTFRKNEVLRILKEGKGEPNRPPRKRAEGNNDQEEDEDDEEAEEGAGKRKRKLLPASSDPNLSSRPALAKPVFRSKKRPPRPPLPSSVRASEERQSVTTTATEATVTAESGNELAGHVYQMVDIPLDEGKDVSFYHSSSNERSTNVSVERSQSLKLSNPREYYLSIRREWKSKHPPRILKPSRLTNGHSERSTSVQREISLVTSKPPAAPRRRVTRRSSLNTPIMRNYRAEENSQVGEDVSRAEDSSQPRAPPRKRRGTSVDRSGRSVSSSRVDVHHPYFPADHYPRSPSSRYAEQRYNERNNRFGNQRQGSLNWTPFSWKTGRCRSLTELYLQKMNLIYSNDEIDFENSIKYKLTTQYCPPLKPQDQYFNYDNLINYRSQFGPEYENISSNRPPICPRISVDRSSCSKKCDVDEPIYSVIKRVKKSPETIQSRPLPSVPTPSSSRLVPLRGGQRSTSRSRSASPYEHRDVAVSTEEDRTRSKTLEREVQTSLEDISSIKTEGIKPLEQSITSRKTVISGHAVGDVNGNPITTVPPLSPQLSAKKTSGDEMSSSRTYYDAESDGHGHEEEEHFDQDTFAGLDDIAADLSNTSTIGTSQYMSLQSSTPTFEKSASKVVVESTSHVQVVTETEVRSSPRPLTPTVRSTSSSRPLAMGIGPTPMVIGRRGPIGGKVKTGSDEEEEEDETELVDLAAELQRELREKVAKRVSQDAAADKDWDKEW